MNNIISPGWYRQGGECGYCHGMPKPNDKLSNPGMDESGTSPVKSPRNNCFNFIAQRLDIDTYVKLLNRGYRRSGSHIYKPDVRNSCCSMYSIRVPVDQYKASKEQRHSINKFNDMIQQQSPNSSIGNESIVMPIKKSKAKGRENEFDLLSKVHQHDRDVRLESPSDTKGSSPKNIPVKLLDDNSALYPDFDFEVRLEEPTYTRTKYELFEKYQFSVHGETDTTPESFKRFLCDNPFFYPDINTINHQTRSGISRVISFDTREFSQSSSPSSNTGDSLTALNPHLLRGPVHQCYYHHGKLICMGVLDLLPRGIVSVYLMWDPTYASFALGRVSAMREIALTMELQRDYYMMGFYIHDCPKMVYKRGFKPCYILDPGVIAADDNESESEINDGEEKYGDSSKSATGKLKAWRPIEDYIKRWDSGEQFVSFAPAYLPSSSDSDVPAATFKSGSKKQDYLEMKVPGVLTRAELKQAIADGEINLLEDILIVIPGSMGKKRVRSSKKNNNDSDDSDSDDDFQTDAVIDDANRLTRSFYTLDFNSHGDSGSNSTGLGDLQTLEDIVNNLPLKGLYQFVDVGMLPRAGQNIALPVLEELTASVGVSVAKTMLVDFR